MRHMKRAGLVRLQSAMEYLMTYGWAILAIAIVMVSLYSLGIFNAGNLQPTAAPGSCQVVRTAVQTSLAGQCNNLIPKYVGQFNAIVGVGGYVQTVIPTGFNISALTVSMWVNQKYYGTGNPGETGVYDMGTTAQAIRIFATTSPTNIQAQLTGPGGSPYRTQFTTTSSLSLNQWAFYTFTFSNGNVIQYINGQSAGGSGTFGASSLQSPSGIQLLGSAQANYYDFTGLIADVQVYNTTLDDSSIKALYQEGIGGAPIDARHLMGWWPLNGNANDYSGNNNQGTISNVIWNANWQSGYAAPTT